MSSASIKYIILKSFASILSKYENLEKIFRFFSIHPLPRKYFKLGAFAFGYVYLEDEPKIRIANLKEYKMYVNICEPLGLQSYFFQDHGTIELIERFLKAGDVCVDAGANMGCYTFFMASKVGSQGKVIAFEPQPRYFEMISNSINLNHYETHVIVDNRALWNRSGEKKSFYLSTNPNNSGTSSLTNHGLYLDINNRIEVETITLSDYLKLLGIEQVRLLKIDVERTELEVLQGMSDQLLQQFVDFIILETYSDSKAQHLLESYGYYAFLINSDDKKLISVQQIKPDYFGDYFYVSPKCNDEFREICSSLILR